MLYSDSIKSYNSPLIFLHPPPYQEPLSEAEKAEERLHLEKSFLLPKSTNKDIQRTFPSDKEIRIYREHWVTHDSEGNDLPGEQHYPQKDEIYLSHGFRPKALNFDGEGKLQLREAADD